MTHILAYVAYAYIFASHLHECLIRYDMRVKAPLTSNLQQKYCCVHQRASWLRYIIWIIGLIDRYPLFWSILHYNPLHKWWVMQPFDSRNSIEITHYLILHWYQFIHIQRFSYFKINGLLTISVSQSLVTTRWLLDHQWPGTLTKWGLIEVYLWLVSV